MTDDVIISDTYGGYRQCYHTDEDCGQLCDETRTVSRDMAVNRMDLYLCGHCEGLDRSNGDKTIYYKAVNNNE